MSDNEEPKGLHYGPVSMGLYRFRLRQTYLRDHAAPMIKARRQDALLLDLALRGMSRRIGATLGNREPEVWAGVTMQRASQPELHDLVRNKWALHEDQKREWVRKQIAYLEGRRLVERFEHPHRGANTVRVLSDRADGELHDDPSGRNGDHYVTINGTLFASGAVTGWAGPEVAFYLAAMLAEASSRTRPEMVHRGDGEWYRSYEWFADADGSRRPPHHVRVPFTKQTLIGGQKRLAKAGFVMVDTITRHPQTGKAFARGSSRNTYLNRFETKSLQLLTSNGIDVTPLALPV